jgi:membrane associated rhomboid family serine protease
MGILIILVTVLISIVAMGQDKWIDRFVFWPYVIKRKNEYWRFITAGFLHADWMHLLFNMLSLYFFAELVQLLLGDILFVALYISSIAAAHVVSYVRHQNDSSYRSLGASGAVSAIIFSAILFLPQMQILVFFIQVPALLYGCLFVIYSLYMDQRDGIVNHMAHLSGAVYGLLFTIIVRPDSLLMFWKGLFEMRFDFF